MQDPGAYLDSIGVELRCPVRPAEPAVLDAGHRALVNHETFFFSDTAALAAFRERPLDYVGLLSDPVSGKRFPPTIASPRLEYHSRPYYFESEASRSAFAADPARYATPQRPMRG